MARRMAAGAEWPMFFAGQNYGLAIFETLPAAVAFKLFGESATVLTATILSLFGVGVVLHAIAFERLSGSRWWGRALAILLALVPGWVVWSTKARGLYVSGFVLTGVLLVLLVRERPRRWHLALGSLVTGCLALVQPLWLVVSLPFWIRLLLDPKGWDPKGRDRSAGGVRDGSVDPPVSAASAPPPRRDVLMAGAAAFTIWLVPTLVASGREAVWQPDFVGSQAGGFTQIRTFLAHAFSGRVTPNDPRALATFIGGAGVVFFVLALTTVAVEAVRKRSLTVALMAGAMLLSVIHVLVLQYWVPRYFLPSTVLLFVAAALLVGRWGLGFGIRAGACTAAVAGLFVASSMGLGRPPEGSVLAETSARDDLRDLIEGLEADGVAGVYAASNDIQWQIRFYSRGTIPTRGRSSRDRYPEIARAVEEARRAGEPTALVADVRRLRDELPEIGGFPGYRVGERYLRLDDPSILELGLVGFDRLPR